jgi:hypothetical protein
MVALLKMPERMRMRLVRPEPAARESAHGPALRLVRPVDADADADADGPERRMFPRKEMTLTVEGRRMDHTVRARQHPHLSLSLRDLSVGGLSALVDAPVAPGERLSVSFPPDAGRRGWDAYGRVLRCTPSGTGYRIAIAFDAIPAAA